MLKDIVLRSCIIPDRQKLIVILSGHDQVDIIIPRNETAMPDRSDQCTVCQRIAQMMLGTYLVNHIQDLLFHSPYLLNLLLNNHCSKTSLCCLLLFNRQCFFVTDQVLLESFIPLKSIFFHIVAIERNSGLAP